MWRLSLGAVATQVSAPLDEPFSEILPNGVDVAFGLLAVA